MSSLNFGDNIKARGRNLHLQTHTIESESKMASTLFDGGRVLAKQVQSYAPETDLSDLEGRVEAWHLSNMKTVEMLYAVSTRVKTVRHAPSLFSLGKIFLKWGLLDEAISELNLAIQYDAHCGDYPLYLSQAYARRGGFEEMVETLENAAAQFPTFADIMLNLGKGYWRLKRHGDALMALEKAVQINPAYDEAYFYLAVILLDVALLKKKSADLPEKERCVKKTQEYLNLITSRSSRFRQARLEEAMRSLHHQQMDQALALMLEIEDHMEPLIDLDFTDEFYLQFLYGEEGRSPQFITDYVAKMEGLVKEHPTFADLRNRMGVAYLIQCRQLFNRALNEFREAVNLNPRFERAQKNLKLAHNEGKGLLILLRAILK